MKYSFACLCVSRSSIEGERQRRVYLGLGGVLLGLMMRFILGRPVMVVDESDE